MHLKLIAIRMQLSVQKHYIQFTLKYITVVVLFLKLRTHFGSTSSITLPVVLQWNLNCGRNFSQCGYFSLSQAWLAFARWY